MNARQPNPEHLFVVVLTGVLASPRLRAVIVESHMMSQTTVNTSLGRYPSHRWFRIIRMSMKSSVFPHRDWVTVQSQK